ncbi:phosphotransferase family protein [Oceanomicrobium pacificus]|uniref:Phosphotransferase n=1 Tax=Oceanomicrobium pacificus TaxID=2692916 RepID=A0A6B0TTB7_9RHOB|nr:aminoglycoside phosphotransferase family protein [Oceanomicrobium pacificus]MXU65045.1 phosphotransferase [Oceanomicrobium pacificus]
MTLSIDARCKQLVADLGIGTAAEVSGVEPLTGGVASDIVRFDLKGQTYCAKFALAKLKVAEDWTAPVHRNAAEYAWLEFAGSVAPACAPRLLGRSAEMQGFVMEFVAGPDVCLWKSVMLDGGRLDGGAERVADLLVRLQAASAAPGFDATAFDNRDDFRALRIEPYLSFTATRHPDLAGPLTALADMLYAADLVLVHGDVSPKNILFRGADPLFLDAECATMGDASFDPSFCLNHLVLKAVHLPDMRAALLADVRAFWTTYRGQVTFEDADGLEARVAALLPALMLARIDGKSPVEYLSEEERTRVRDISRDLIARPETRIDALVARLEEALQVQPASTTMV